MLKRNLALWLLASLIAAPAAKAEVSLIAIGTLNGNDHDRSTKTAGPLENGVAGNTFGGIGSGIAYAGCNTFIATPDRGPNAKDYNSAVDNTTSYINRFQTLNLRLKSNSTAGALPFTLDAKLVKTTLLYSPTPLFYGNGAGLGNPVDGSPLGAGAPDLNKKHVYYFTGRSDNFDPTQPSTNPGNARFDPEGVRVAKNGESVFISDEYGPYVYQFDRGNGRRIRTFNLPSNLAVKNLSSVGDTEISGNTSGRVANKGMEGLAITPDGRTLVGIVQAALIQDPGKTVRIVTIDTVTGTTHEYAYTLTTGSGVSEIVAINDHEFLVDERDGKGLGDNSTAKVKQLFKIDLTGAKDVSALSGDLSGSAVSKTLFLDIVDVLTKNGISAKDIPAKIEGLALSDAEK